MPAQSPWQLGYAWCFGVSALLNIALDLLFVLRFSWGVGGAAAATVIAQYVSGAGIFLYTVFCCKELRPRQGGISAVIRRFSAI